MHLSSKYSCAKVDALSVTSAHQVSVSKGSVWKPNCEIVHTKHILAFRVWHDKGFLENTHSSSKQFSCNYVMDVHVGLIISIIDLGDPAYTLLKAISPSHRGSPILQRKCIKELLTGSKGGLAVHRMDRHGAFFFVCGWVCVSVCVCVCVFACAVWLSWSISSRLHLSVR